MYNNRLAFKRIISKIRIEYIVLILVSLIMCLPLFNKGFLITHDGTYHVGRLYGTVQCLKDGQFLPAVIQQYGNGFGFSWNLFYPPLFAYIGAFLKIFITSYITVTKMILVLFTIISAISMYNLMMEITNKKSVSLITSIIYITSPYKLTGMYVRMSIGEILSSAFMPILFQGLYNLFNKDGSKNYLIIIGTVGIMLSHNISTLLVGIFSVIYVLLHITKLKDKKVLCKLFIDAIFVITMVGFFYGPLIESKNAANYAVFEEGFMNSKDLYANHAVHIRQLFDNNFTWGWSHPLGSEEDIINEMNFAIGLQIIIPLLLIPFVLKKIPKCQRKTYWFALILGLLSIWATTTLFPRKLIFNALTILQFSWRLFMISTFALSIVAGMTLSYEFKNIHKKYIAISIIAMIIYMLPYFWNLNYDKNFNEQELLLPSFSGESCANFEYLPARARTNMDYIGSRDSNAIISEGTGALENQQKDGSRMSFNIVQNDSDNLKIELPYIFYIGYSASLDGEELPLTESENGFLEINLNNHSTGTVSIKYTGSKIMNITKIISIISTCLFVGYWIWSIKRNKTTEI